jgi:ketosteroid isomerase-like protein
MSESVEVVKRVIDAFNREDVDAAVDSMAQDLVFDFSNSRGPMSGVYRGREGMREFLTSFGEAWAELEFDPQEEMVELDDGRVVTVNAFRGRGQESGVEVEAAGAGIWTIRRGEVAAMTFYQSKEEALEAASLER